MEEVIWIEVLSRHRDVSARHRFTQAEVRIGRGYANDVFIDDPGVAPDHLRIFRDETGALFAESRSGGTVSLSPADGDHPIKIGNTSLRVRDSSYAIAPAEVEKPTAAQWGVDVALALGVIVAQLLSVWLQEVGETRAVNYVRPILIAALVVLVWVGGWSILTRVFSGHARFAGHLRVALSGLLAYEVITPALSTLAFSLSAPSLAAYGYVVAALVLGTICVLHLREVGPSHLPAKMATVSALTIAAIGFVTLSQLDGRDNADEQVQFRRAMPPMLRLAPAKTDTTFMSDAEQLRAKLDQDRSKEPPANPDDDD